MADSLSLLREYQITKREIIERDGQIIFGEFSWPKHVKTNYLMWGSNKHGQAKEYYTLESVLFMLKNAALNHPVYVRTAVAENIPVVRRPDRKELLAYLNGETASCGAVDKSAPPEIPTRVKRSTEDDGAESAAKKPRFEDAHVQKVREKLAARLDAHKEASVTVENIKSLSEAMSVETIAAIRAKRLTKKRTTIKENNEEDDIVQDCEIRAILDLDMAETKNILSRERQWQTRVTILQSNGVTFAKNILAMLQSIQARELGKQRMQDMPKEALNVAKKEMPKEVQQPVVYNRYDQERFNRPNQETEGFKIDTMGTYRGMTLKSVTEKPVVPAPKREARSSSGGLQKRVSRTPIIIIPAGGNSLISMYNIREILQDLKFVSVEQKKAEGATRDTEVLIQRQKNGQSVPYRIVDNPAKLTSSDWDCVVAVFVLGPTWQFKDFPWTDPVDIFTKVAAFHIKYDNMKVNPNVAKWAVNVIEVSTTKRHLDRAALMVFWEKLDRHIMQFKPHLRF